MGIKCSLLGHSFTGTSVEEEREEQGSEVVITIKEVETCERCGKTRVVSENKEVRSIESASAVEGAEPEPEPGPDASASESAGTPAGGSSPSPDIDAAEDDAELIEEAEQTESEPAPDPEPDTATSDAASGATEEPAPAQDPADTTAGTDDTGVDAAESHDDDAVILDDDDEDEPDREPGEWPEETRREDPGEAVDATDTAEWPDEDGGDDDEWEPSESLTSEIDEAEVKPAGSATVTVPEGQFECAECGFRTDVESSSLRAGDFCPECKTGTLEYQSEE
jgi:hypothetical protein